MMGAMTPSDLIGVAFVVFFLAPVTAAFIIVKGGSPELRAISRYVLLVAWIAYAVATFACLRIAFGPQTGGIGNGIFMIIAIPLTVVGLIFFGVWKGALRQAYVQSLPPGFRAVEELEDLDRAIEALRKNIAFSERQADRWGLSSAERTRLRAQVEYLRSTLEEAEHKRAEMAAAKA